MGAHRPFPWVQSCWHSCSFLTQSQSPQRLHTFWVPLQECTTSFCLTNEVTKKRTNLKERKKKRISWVHSPENSRSQRASGTAGARNSNAIILEQRLLNFSVLASFTVTVPPLSGGRDAGMSGFCHTSNTPLLPDNFSSLCYDSH